MVRTTWWLMFAMLAALCAPCLNAAEWGPAVWAPKNDQRVQYRAKFESDKLYVEAVHGEGPNGPYHTYALDNTERGGQNKPTSLAVEGALELTGAWTSPEPDDMSTPVWPTWGFHGTVVFEAPVKRIAGDATTVLVSGQACDVVNCATFKNIKVSVPLTAGAATSNGSSTPPPDVEKKVPVAVASGEAGVTGKLYKVKDTSGIERWWMALWKGKTVTVEQGMLDFILLCIGGALIALLMPCVFPMIPITVSFFGKQADATGKPTAGLAFVYGLGIILSYTGIGLILTAATSDPGAIAALGNSTGLALALAFFFLVFALSMFGMFELRLPSGIAQKFNLQGKAGGVGGSFLLGTTFAVTSMACTVPVVASILGIALTTGDYWKPTIGMVTYSATIALPFVILAAAPGMLKKLPRAGGWMNAVKVVFGFIELAAAAEFFGWARWISREFVVAIWVACFLLSALYLLGIFRGSHDMKIEGVSASRMVFVSIFLSIALWLSTGLYGGKLGFVESFLRDDSAKGWTVNADLQAALEDARDKRKAVFVDVTGMS